MKFIAWLGTGIFLCSTMWAQQQPAPPPPAEEPKATGGSINNDRDTGPSDSVEHMFAFSIYGWNDRNGPAIRAGTTTAFPATTHFQLPEPPRAFGISATLPMSGFTSLEISYFRVNSSTQVIAPDTSTFGGFTFLPGDIIEQAYDVQNFKVSWNYLTFPAPPQGAKFRVKTLWEVQYLRTTPVLIPLANLNDVAKIRHSIIYPTLGAGIEFVPSAKFRMEVRGSGFAIPGRATLWDAEGTASLRVRHVEIFGGMKAYHFKTTPKSNEYVIDTLWGPMLGARWVFR